MVFLIINFLIIKATMKKEERYYENILNGEPELVLKETVLLAQRSSS